MVIIKMFGVTIDSRDEGTGGLVRLSEALWKGLDPVIGWYDCRAK